MTPTIPTPILKEIQVVAGAASHYLECGKLDDVAMLLEEIEKLASNHLENSAYLVIPYIRKIFAILRDPDSEDYFAAAKAEKLGALALEMLGPNHPAYEPLFELMELMVDQDATWECNFSVIEALESRIIEALSEGF